MSDVEVVTVPAAAEEGVKSSVTVQQEDVFTVNGSGRANFDRTRVTYPDGTQYIDGKYAGARTHPETTLPGVPVGLLLARVGSGPWLAVGSQQTFRAQEDGEITLAYNDRPGMYGDNSGEYTALIENHGPLT